MGGKKFLVRNAFADLSLSRRPITIFFHFITISFFFLPLYSLSYGVPAIPNRAILEGTVKEYCAGSSQLWNIEPEQVIFKLTVLVQGVHDSEVVPNFLKDKEGQMLAFFTKETILPELLYKRIKAEVEYRGDEKGGRFWIRNIQVLQEGK